MKVQLVLIHNNNLKRNATILPSLAALCVALEKEHAVSLAKISFQPALPEIQLCDTLVRGRFLKSVEDQWRAYLKMEPFVGEADVLSTRKDPVSTAIELCLTDKHLRAWDVFAESGSDFLICFEDDATFNKHSIERLLKTLRFVSSLPPTKGLYADLAGGLPLSVLGVESLILGLHDEMLFFEKPVSNTTCTYLLNRAIIIDFKRRLLLNPNYRFIPSDWLLNMLFIERLNSGVSTNCFHAYPSIFAHGSVISNESSVREAGG